MSEIIINVENVQKAFREAGENPAIQELLINLFGKENVEPEQPKDVRERAGFSAYASVAFSKSRSKFGSRLAFKNRELAEYSGKQFIDIYKDFVA